MVFCNFCSRLILMTEFALCRAERVMLCFILGVLTQLVASSSYRAQRCIVARQCCSVVSGTCCDVVEAYCFHGDFVTPGIMHAKLNSLSTCCALQPFRSC